MKCDINSYEPLIDILPTYFFLRLSFLCTIPLAQQKNQWKSPLALISSIYILATRHEPFGPNQQSFFDFVDNFVALLFQFSF